ASSRPRALARLARSPSLDTWTQTALLSSVGTAGPDLLKRLAGDPTFTRAPTANQLQLVTALAALVGAGGKDDDLAAALGVGGSEKSTALLKAALLEGLGQGLQNSARSLTQFWEAPPARLKEAVATVLPLFQEASATARNGKKPLEDRLAAARLLGFAPFARAAEAAEELLTPQTPPELQLAAVRCLAPHAQPKVGDLLLAPWDGYSPAVRREVVEALFARRDRVERLVGALEKKVVLASQLEP